MSRTTLYLRGIVLLLLVALAACGGEPVTFAQLPLHPQATPLEPGSHPMADTVADGFRQALSGGNVTMDVQLYSLPADASWETVRSFYETQVAGDWKTEPALAQDTEFFKTIGWSRGSFASEQGLAVGYGPPLLGSPPFLMVALFSE
jgi:hypothetical protein